LLLQFQSDQRRNRNGDARKGIAAGTQHWATLFWANGRQVPSPRSEIAEFGIEVPLVKPGTARTNISSSSDDATSMEMIRSRWRKQ